MSKAISCVALKARNASSSRTSNVAPMTDPVIEPIPTDHDHRFVYDHLEEIERLRRHEVEQASEKATCDTGAAYAPFNANASAL